jgi:hypothetical protein
VFLQLADRLIAGGDRAAEFVDGGADAVDLVHGVPVAGMVVPNCDGQHPAQSARAAARRCGCA